MKDYKILVVDDEQNIRDIFQAFLRDMGYRVSTAIDGLDALEKIAIDKFDLYIVDIYMPRMGGLELISRLKEIQPSAVIIVTTGYSGLDVDFRSIRQSAFMYLAKPIQPDELIRAVEAGLAQKHGLSSDKPPLAMEEQPESDKQPELLLLRGFSTDQVLQFKSMGMVKEYNAGDFIPMDKEDGSMIFVERGYLNVFYNTDLVDSLKAGDIWGEETFISPGALFTSLRAHSNSAIRYFPRKRLIEFFTYNDKGLTDRFMINLIQCMNVKWRRSIVRLGLLSRNNQADDVR
ncbi:MAG: response regulator [Candidatus Cloacimonadaceae bacterium]|jgi:CheY-like chemotaxis protein/CRP-like cAMP-binding protein|nr:response regulator [Candidatus Cloacimonadota bacterium]MCK9178154.1 response regulator [Candidatus Cloacimonadota bacterium]MDD3104428.1 response regulator [Candidatus Cloacimonadota bacterium]MDY0126752.1 response regulator [Candidatus Cloacimonadaceae bacterium]